MNRSDPQDARGVAPSQLSGRQAADSISGSQQRAAADAAVWRQRADTRVPAAATEPPVHAAGNVGAPGRLRDVPPPGARVSYPAQLARQVYAALPPGGGRVQGRRMAVPPSPLSAPPSSSSSPAPAPASMPPTAHAATPAQASPHQAPVSASASAASADAVAAAEAGLRAARAAQAAADATSENRFGTGFEPPPVSAWATPVGATTHAEFHPDAAAANAWTGTQEEPQQAGAISRPVLWGLILLIAAMVTAGAIWTVRHFETERELAALARVAALPGAPSEPPLDAARTAPAAPAEPGPAATAPEVPPAQTPSPPAVTEPTPEAPPPIAQENPPAAARPRTPPSTRNAAPPRRAAVPPSAIDERAMAKLSPKAREYLYSQAFRRCPAPGQAGALQCRKHICNGAEGRSPACYHINRLNL